MYSNIFINIYIEIKTYPEIKITVRKQLKY